MEELKRDFEFIISTANLECQSPNELSKFVNWAIGRLKSEKVAIIEAHLDMGNADEEIKQYDQS